MIPARLESTRFPGKALYPLGGIPMLERVWRQAKTLPVDQVYVVTPNGEIQDHMQGCGAQVIRTRFDHETGSDRVWEAAQSVCHPEDIIINIQGDLPIFSAPCVGNALQLLQTHSTVSVATLVQPMSSTVASQPQRVKVAFERCLGPKHGICHYFSRALIPGERGAFFHHIGIYIYRYPALKQWASHPTTALEQAESIEVLRGYTLGWRVGAVETDQNFLSVDVPQDVPGVEAFLNAERLPASH